ncbi:MAG: redoxin domain-containing protein [Bacillota bacterium]
MKKTISILLAILLVSMLSFAAFADDNDENESENERYEETEQDEDDGRNDDESQAGEQGQDEEDERFDLIGFFAGTGLDLSQYAGQAVLINFFTEWCPYCMEEMPDIKQVFDTYDPNSLEIILVHPWDGEDASNTASVVSRFGLEGVTTIEDEDFALTTLVGVPGYPTSIFVDPDGYLYHAVASKIDFSMITSIFDDMGIPRRDGTAALPASTQRPSDSTAVNTTNADATTGATPQD